MGAALKLADSEFGGGDGGGPCDPRDVTIYILEQQLAEFRAAMRRLLDSEGADATEAIAEAERLCDAYDQVDREVEDEQARDAFHAATHCDCGTFKGARTSFCPECDADAIERLKKAPDWTNVATIGPCPF